MVQINNPLYRDSEYHLFVYFQHLLQSDGLVVSKGDLEQIGKEVDSDSEWEKIYVDDI